MKTFFEAKKIAVIGVSRETINFLNYIN